MNKNDAISQIYSNNKIKQQLINYIYTTVDLSKFKYKILETYEDLHILSTQKYLISGEYSGSSSLLVFTRNKDRYYSFLVERKTLSYRSSQINMDSIVIKPIEIRLEESIYDGTIFDGIYVHGEDPTFIINDMYCFRGNDMSHDKINYKIINIKQYLDSFLKHDQNLKTIKLSINKLYPLENIKTLVNNVIPNTKDFQVKGLSFYPEISGTKLIYLFTPKQENIRQAIVPSISINPKNNFMSQKQYYNHHTNNPNHPNQTQYGYQNYQNYQDRQTNQHEQFMDTGYSQHSSYNQQIIPTVPFVPSTQPKIKKVIKYVRKTDEQIILTFEMKKTDSLDVYKLFLVEKCQRDGKTILKSRRIGIAYIPTKDCSHMCKNLTLKTGKSLVKCQYNDLKEKWVPLEEDKNRKYPDLFSLIEEKMEIIEEDISDDEL